MAQVGGLREGCLAQPGPVEFLGVVAGERGARAECLGLGGLGGLAGPEKAQWGRHLAPGSEAGAAPHTLPPPASAFPF